MSAERVAEKDQAAWIRFAPFLLAVDPSATANPATGSAANDMAASTQPASSAPTPPSPRRCREPQLWGGEQGAATEAREVVVPDQTNTRSEASASTHARQALAPTR